MPNNSMKFMPNAALPLRGVTTAAVGSESAIATGQSDETLQLFAAIHKSKRFSVEAAHQSFAGLKRKKQ